MGLTMSLFQTIPGNLQGASLRNWLRTDGAGIFTAFETGVDALNYVRELGVVIPRSTFYEIRREVLDVVLSSDKLINYPDNQLIPLKWHVRNHGLDLTTEFQYRIHLFGADLIDGKLTDSWMTVASDRQLTKDQIRDVARSYVGEGGVSGDLTDYRFAEIEPLRA